MWETWVGFPVLENLESERMTGKSLSASQTKIDTNLKTAAKQSLGFKNPSLMTLEKSKLFQISVS